jgi:hypothetical protein
MARGIDSIIEAVEECGATRVGVAHHMVDDVFVSADGSIEVGARLRRSVTPALISRCARRLVFACTPFLQSNTP